MIEKVISGGQTGADQAGWRAAKALGIPTGGWMPLGLRTEDGSRPDLARLYIAAECPDPGYPARTRRNVEESDWTIWFGSPTSDGAIATWRAFQRKTGDADRTAGLPIYAKGFLTVYPEHSPHHMPASSVAHVLKAQGCRVLNVAGNRESKYPGIGAWVEAYLTEVFRLLREGP